ncbi:MAG: hypothetical protein MZW92_31390 [Comamonadaceae bacterium]|nr:hypothetical protein [Comamonadaceae bacterium]
MMLQEGEVLSSYTDHVVDGMTSGNPWIDEDTIQNILKQGAVSSQYMVIANTDNLIPNGTSSLTQYYGKDVPEGRGMVLTGGVDSGACRQLSCGQTWAVTGNIPVRYLDHYYFSAVRAVPSASHLGAATIYIGLYDAAGNSLGTVSPNINPPYLTNYHEVSGSFQVTNASTSFIRVFITHQDTLAGGDVRFDNLYLRQRNTGQLIVDGTITSNHVVTAGLSADVIKAGTLNASLVTVTNLSAASITTGSMSADRIGTGYLSTDRLQVGSLDLTKLASNLVMPELQSIESQSFGAPGVGSGGSGFKLRGAPFAVTLRDGTSFNTNLVLGIWVL